MDPSQAQFGLSCAQVLGRDATAPNKGPVLRVFATIIRPETFPQVSLHPPTVPQPPSQALPAPPVSTNGPSTPSRHPSNGAVPNHAAEARQGQALHLGRIAFSPGTEVRRFVAIPEGATWGQLLLRAGEHDTPRWVLAP